MHTHAFSRKDAKRFADRLLKRLERDGTAVTYPQILEALAAGFDLRDWNTLCATLRDDSGEDISKQHCKAALGGLQEQVHEWRTSTEVSFAPSMGTSPFCRSASGGSVELVLGAPGKGKSMLLGIGSLEFCLGRHHLGPTPRLGVVEIGPGSAGVVSMLADFLPSERKHEVAYRRLRMTPKTAVNAFDTPLGQRVPGRAQTGLLRNLLAIMLLDSDQPDPEILQAEADISAMALEICSAWWSDAGPTSRPAPYVRGTSAAIDMALARHSGPLPRTWWQIVDLLFSAGDLRHAVLAQHQAVPTMADVVEALVSADVRHMFGHHTAADGESLIASMHRRIAQWLRSYPNLSRKTGLDLAGARAVALDIQEIAPGGVFRQDNQQTAISYLLARHAVAGEMFCPAGEVAIPELYRAHHSARCDSPGTAAARLVLDDVHRVGSLKPVADQILADARQARGCGITLVLSSQKDTDFEQIGADMVWLAGAGRQEDAEKLGAHYCLSAQARRIVVQKLNGPTSRGNSFLLVRNEGATRHEELHVFKLDPQELWGLATTDEDVVLRQSLYRHLGGIEARRRLARHFPSGSAISEIHRQLLSERGSEPHYHMVSGQHMDSIIDRLAMQVAAMDTAISVQGS